MPYYDLALSMNEFEMLTRLVDQLIDITGPVPELMDQTFVSAEVHRIQKAALRDVSLFHKHYPHYIRVQLSSVYGLMIRLHEIRLALPEAVLRAGITHYKFQHCHQLLLGLLQLESFYSDLVKELQKLFINHR